MDFHFGGSSSVSIGTQHTPFLFFLSVLALAIVGAIYRGIAERKRREAFQRLAMSLGLTYVQRDDSADEHYSALDVTRQGDTRYAFNILRGKYKQRSVDAFDYHYATHSTDSKGNRQTQDHYLSVFVLALEQPFPELRIYPENFWGRLAEMVGYNDIDFESVEFSRAFTVRSTDRKFAYDICHTRMMAYLLEHRELRIEIDGPYLALIFNSRLQPEQVVSRLDQLIDIRDLFPQYLYRS